MMRAVLRQVRDAWQRPAVLVLAVLAGCFALASAADARADLAGRDRALATMIRNLGGSARRSSSAPAGMTSRGMTGWSVPRRSMWAIRWTPSARTTSQLR